MVKFNIWFIGYRLSVGLKRNPSRNSHHWESTGLDDSELKYSFLDAAVVDHFGLFSKTHINIHNFTFVGSYYTCTSEGTFFFVVQFFVTLLFS